jgi:hypothetical protein
VRVLLLGFHVEFLRQLCETCVRVVFQTNIPETHNKKNVKYSLSLKEGIHMTVAGTIAYKFLAHATYLHVYYYN